MPDDTKSEEANPTDNLSLVDEIDLTGSESDTSNEAEKWTVFRLEYPNGYPYDRETYDKLYTLVFYENVERDSLSEIIKSNIKIWLNSYKTNTPLTMATTKSGNTTEYYSNIEKRFLTNDEASLSSNLLDEVIQGKAELLDSHSNGVLAWNLANYMQTYALNYLKQTENAESILYFYMFSIKYTQESLTFEMSKDEKYRQIRYLRSRYKDIADCKIINETTREQADYIYTSIQTELNVLQPSQSNAIGSGIKTE